MESTENRFTKVDHDINGNPRYVCHFFDMLTDNEIEKLSVSDGYDLAIKIAKQIGGKKYRGREYGGGIVFTSYCLDNIAERIELMKAERADFVQCDACGEFYDYTTEPAEVKEGGTNICPDCWNKPE